MSNTKSKRIRRSSDQWSSVLSDQRASGLSQVEFCKREGIALSTFARWRQRLSVADPGTTGLTPAPQAGIVMPEPVYRLRITDRVEAGGKSAYSAPERSEPPPSDSSSTADRAGGVTDVGVDRTIEERVIADARLGEGENLLSQGAEKEI